MNNNWIIQERLGLQRHETDLERSKKTMLMQQAMANRGIEEHTGDLKRTSSPNTRSLTRRVIASAATILMFWLP